MWMTLFSIARPFVQSAVSKRVAQAAADYLNQRRAQRLQPQDQDEATSLPAASTDAHPEEAALPADEAEPVVVYAPVPVGFSGLDVFWFTLSGFFFGGAIGVILAYVTRKQEA